MFDDAVVRAADVGPVGVGSLDAALDRLVDLEADLARLHAQQVAVLARIGELGGGPDGISADLVALTLRVGLRTAQHRIAIAQSLHRDLPATRAALNSGDLPFSHARAIAEATWQLPQPDPTEPDTTEPDTADELVGSRLEAAVLDRAPEQTLTQLRAALRRAVIRLDPATARQRHQTARADRGVWLHNSDDGMATLTALLPAPEAHTLYQRLTDRSRTPTPTDPRSRDPRSRDQRRADLLTDTLLTHLNQPEGSADQQQNPARPGLAPSVQLLIAASTLLGHDDEPGWLNRYGPLTADQARQLAHDPTGSWHRVITDPTGQPLAYGSRRYRPPAALTRHLTLRDPTCVFPTCNQPADQADLDHTIPHHTTGNSPPGPTNPDNLAPLCRRHHNHKTLRTATYHRNPDNTYTWTIHTNPQPPTRPRKYTNHPPTRWQPPPTYPEHPPF